jgi:hypothetical protein
MNQPGGQVAEMEPSVPLGMGDFETEGGGDPLLTGGDEERRLNTGVLLIVVVLLLAVGLLFTMRQLSQAPVEAEQTEAEGQIAEFLTKLANDSGEDRNALTVIKNDFPQVQLSDVQRDPFQAFDRDAVITPNGSTPVATNDTASRLREQEARYAELQQIGHQGIELKSVLMGRPPLANINGKVVRVGEDVMVGSVAFMVVSIETDMVKLMTEDEAHGIAVEVEVMVERN